MIRQWWNWAAGVRPAQVGPAFSAGAAPRTAGMERRSEPVQLQEPVGFDIVAESPDLQVKHAPV